MTKIVSFILTLIVGFVPTFNMYSEGIFNEEKRDDGGGSTIIAAKKKTTLKPCKDGYFRSPLTNRCKKLVTVSESKSTITTTTYDPRTGKATVKKTCKSGYWWNKKTEHCNKKKECKIGYRYQSSDNTCKKNVCEIGYKVQDSSNKCKRLICERGHILNLKTGNCVINRKGKYKECKDGWTLDLYTLQCALIGTSGSNDPRSKAAKKSMSSVKYSAYKKPITLSSITKTDETKTEEKTCPEGKFLNPKTNRCKNLQDISETSTGKTITTYNPETGEATVVKVCNEGYILNAETNRCNKEKSESSTKTSSLTKTCPEGKFLNPETNRCKNLQTVTESTTGKTITTYDPKTGKSKTEKICNEGYVLDKDSNRCKKQKENKGEDYKLDVPELGEESKDTFTAISSVIVILAIGTGFVIFQYRHEIAKFFKSLFPGKKR